MNAKFNVGDRVRVAARYPETGATRVHIRTPHFLRGRTGVIERVLGTFPDPETAHAVRLERLPARALAAVADRVTAQVHGTCVGAGVELAAFCHQVVADPGTTFRLPEVAMGLVPGQGGTVSLRRRIGPARTGWLALSGQAIDAPTALAWGLVDRIEPSDALAGGA